MILIKLLTSYSHVLGNISQKSLVFHRKSWYMYQYFTEKANGTLFWVLNCRESINCIISLRKSGVFFYRESLRYFTENILVFLTESTILSLPVPELASDSASTSDSEEGVGGWIVFSLIFSVRLEKARTRSWRYWLRLLLTFDKLLLLTKQGIETLNFSSIISN